MGRLDQIWRHPIKSHGREAIGSVLLEAGKTMPGDRVWAIRHEASTATNDAWSPCANFSRGSKAPGLMAINATYDEAAQTVELTHPNRPPLTIKPDDNPPEFFDWIAPIMPADRAASAEILRVPGRGMTDSDFPSISLINLSSHRAVAQKLGRDISAKRWRCNLWLDGLAPWEEFEWIGRTLRIGEAELQVKERILRCMATTASTRTGKRDADTLGALNGGWDHQDFGVYAQVTKPGRIATGDTVQLL